MCWIDFGSAVGGRQNPKGSPGGACGHLRWPSGAIGGVLGMLGSEHRMIGDGSSCKDHENHAVNRMIQHQMEGGGQGRVGGLVLNCFT